MQKALIYCRVSTEEQANKGLSLDAQEKACSKAAKEAGHTSVEVVRDEGKSAGNLNRPGLQKILKLCEERKVKAIYMIHSDRLARNTEDHLKLRRLFQENAIKVVYVFQPNLSDNSAFGKTMDTVMAAFNEMQRLVISEKTKSALLEKVKEGWFPGTAPLGYMNVDNKNPNNGEISKRIITVDPEVAPFIKEMFELYATGHYSVEELINIMHARGLRSRRNKKLHPSKVFDTLKNPIYVGELHWGGIVIRKAKHQPIVPRDIFERVQLIMAGHNNYACRKRKHQFLLRGFLYCSCKRRMTAEWHVKKSGLKYAYYHCIQGRDCSHSRYINIQDIEQEVENKFKDIKFSPEFISQVTQELQKIYQDHKKKVQCSRRRLYNKKTAVEQQRETAERKLLKGVILDEDFVRIRDELKNDLDDIEDELSKLEEQRKIKIEEFRKILKFTRNIYRAYKEEPAFEIKRRYLSFFWEKFEVEGNRIAKAVPSLLFRELLDCQRVLISSKWGQRPEIIITGLAKKLIKKEYVDELSRLWDMLKLFKGISPISLS
ncbi:MAG: recombinase family protein [Promethearchaeota archaeon]